MSIITHQRPSRERGRYPLFTAAVHTLDLIAQALRPRVAIVRHHPSGQSHVHRQLLAAALSLTIVAGDTDSLGISFRAPTSAPHTARAIHASTHITSQVVWDASRVHEIHGEIVVADGGTLVIEAGTRVEAQPGATITVSREGQIVADGTILQPITLTCTSPVKYEGCWGGISLRGFARVNDGPATSPAARGSGAAGCKQHINSGAPYGGCDDADASGSLRFVRVEYAATGLELLAAGSGTIVDHVQVNRSRSSGLSIVGGTVDVKHAMLTANFEYGLAWKGGWRGRAQFVTVQQNANRLAGGIFGSNEGLSPAAITLSPRSAPQLYNVTLVTPSVATNPLHGSPPAAIRIAKGSSGELRNVLVYRPEVVLDLDDDATCESFGGANSFALSHILIAGAITNGDPDGADPSSCGFSPPGAEAALIAATPSAALVTDPATVAAMLINGVDVIYPDLRPINGTTAPIMTPPTDGFFDPLALFAGSHAIAALARNNIPWYAGWTEPAPQPPAPGSVAGLVSSPSRGPLPGVLISSTIGVTTSSNAAAMYTLGLPAGSHILQTSELPQGCGSPPVAVSVPIGGTVTRDISVDCTVVTDLSASSGHACGSTAAGPTICWGRNDAGQLGDGTGFSPRTVPVAVSGGQSFVAVTTGQEHSCGLTAAGQAFCWGLNAFGALGFGTVGGIAITPVPVSDAVPFVKISAGSYHTCALTSAGAAYCWGWNQEGQIGNGTVSSGETSAKLVLSGGLVFTAINAGESHTCALTNTGDAYCWGGNGRGELGTDPAVTGTQQSTPVAVPGGFIFSQIDGGLLHTCGVTTTGVGLCWGDRSDGQVGDGVVGAPVFGPTPVSGSLTFRQISAGALSSCGVTTGDALYCWGNGEFGALGDGTNTLTQATPVAVSGALTAQRVSVSTTTTNTTLVCAQTTVGEVWCWGVGALGQLGDGTVTPHRNTPVQVKVPAP